MSSLAIVLITGLASKFDYDEISETDSEIVIKDKDRTVRLLKHNIAVIITGDIESIEGFDDE